MILWFMVKGSTCPLPQYSGMNTALETQLILSLKYKVFKCESQDRKKRLIDWLENIILTATAEL